VLNRTHVLKWTQVAALFGATALLLATRIFIVTQQTFLKLMTLLKPHHFLLTILKLTQQARQRLKFLRLTELSLRHQVQSALLARLAQRERQDRKVQQATLDLLAQQELLVQLA
jgi:hypothetical protein